MIAKRLEGTSFISSIISKVAIIRFKVAKTCMHNRDYPGTGAVISKENCAEIGSIIFEILIFL